MTPSDGAPYMIRHASGQGDDEWISPEPADEVIVDAVVAAADVELDDVNDLSSYVDVSSLTAVLEGEEAEISFTVEGHEVLVTSDGSVDVTVE